MLNHAIELAERGMRVFPLHNPENDGCSCGNPECGKNTGKHPRIYAWPNMATTDKELIAMWWKQWPDANIGIATGQGIVVIDLDSKDAVMWGKKHLAPTVTARTSRGAHYYYTTPTEIQNKSNIIAEVDIRGDGGYVVAPPSKHLSGVTYEWSGSLPSNDMPAIDMGIFTKSQKNTSQGSLIEVGERHDRLVKVAFAMWHRGCPVEEIYQELRTVNLTKCNSPMTDSEIKTMADSMVQYGRNPKDAVTAPVAVKDIPKVFSNELELLQSYLYSGVKEVLKRGTEEPVYELVAEHPKDKSRDYTVVIGDANALLNPMEVRTKIYAALDHQIPRMKRCEKWDAITHAIVEIAQIVFTTTSGELMRDYLHDMKQNSDVKWFDLIHQKEEIIHALDDVGRLVLLKGDRIIFTLHGLKHIMKTTFICMSSEKQIAKDLTRIGFKPHRMCHHSLVKRCWIGNISLLD